MSSFTENLPQEEFIIPITKKDIQEYKRLDHFLCKKMPDLSRSFIKNLYLNDLIYFQNQDDKSLKPELKKMPKTELSIVIQIPPPVPTEARPENIPLDIIYEDEHLLFVNKAAGMVTHPAPGNHSGTLVNAILHHCTDLKSIGNKIRPGIVHRLDKGTSGIMVVAKNQKTYEGLVLLFSSHNINRIYQAMVMGIKIPSYGILEGKIGRHRTKRTKMAIDSAKGRASITHYKVLEYFSNLTHIELKLETGRTHQIRVHLSSLLNNPILNDYTYGNPNQDIRRLSNIFKSTLASYQHPFLHAKTLGLTHPVTKEEMFFEIPPPTTFQTVLNLARSEM